MWYEGGEKFPMKNGNNEKEFVDLHGNFEQEIDTMKEFNLSCDATVASFYGL